MRRTRQMLELVPYSVNDNLHPRSCKTGDAGAFAMRPLEIQVFTAPESCLDSFLETFYYP